MKQLLENFNVSYLGHDDIERLNELERKFYIEGDTDSAKLMWHMSDLVKLILFMEEEHKE